MTELKENHRRQSSYFFPRTYTILIVECIEISIFSFVRVKNYNNISCHYNIIGCIVKSVEWTLLLRLRGVTKRLRSFLLCLNCYSIPLQHELKLINNTPDFVQV